MQSHSSIHDMCILHACFHPVSQIPELVTVVFFLLLVEKEVKLKLQVRKNNIGRRSDDTTKLQNTQRNYDCS